MPDFNLYTQETFRSSLNVRKKWDEFDLQATFFGSDRESSYDSPLSSTYASVDYNSKAMMNDFGLNVQGSLPLGKHNYITAGGDFKRGTLDTDYIYESRVRRKESGGKQDIYGIFAQDEINLFREKLILTLGVRNDWFHSLDGYSDDTAGTVKKQTFDDRMDSAFDPKAAVLFHVNDYISLRSSVGMAFRAPDLNNLYRGDWSYGTITYRGNPNLKPETLTSCEFGIDYKIKDKFKFATTYYHTDAEDFIYIISTSDPNIRQYTNVGKVEINGLEMDAELKLTSTLRLFSNLTLDKSKVIEFKQNTDMEGKYLSWLPRSKISFGFVYDNPKFVTARLDGRYVGVIYDDDMNQTEVGKYFTADVQLSRKLMNNLEVIFEVNDLLDASYQETNSVISPGRTFMGRLKFTF
jgi:iron complex outermembrane receptor protein